MMPSLYTFFTDRNHTGCPLRSYPPPPPPCGWHLSKLYASHVSKDLFLLFFLFGLSPFVPPHPREYKHFDSPTEDPTSNWRATWNSILSLLFSSSLSLSFVASLNKKSNDTKFHFGYYFFFLSPPQPFRAHSLYSWVVLCVRVYMCTL